MWKRRACIIIFLVYLAIIVILCVSVSGPQQPTTPKPCPTLSVQNVKNLDYHCLVSP